MSTFLTHFNPGDDIVMFVHTDKAKYFLTAQAFVEKNSKAFQLVENA